MSRKLRARTRFFIATAVVVVSVAAITFLPKLIRLHVYMKIIEDADVVELYEVVHPREKTPATARVEKLTFSSVSYDASTLRRVPVGEPRSRLISIIRRGNLIADSFTAFGLNFVVVAGCTRGPEVVEFIFAVGGNTASIYRSGEKIVSFHAGDEVAERLLRFDP